MYRSSTMKTYICQYCSKENAFKGHSYANKYCDNKCQGAATRDARISTWLNEGFKWGNNIPSWIRDKDGYLARERGYACECCGISKWNGNDIVLEVDHIDGNKKDNSPTNLRLICPNCHSQTDTFKGRNKNKPQ